jgi:hypothetical protein
MGDIIKILFGFGLPISSCCLSTAAALINPRLRRAWRIP